MSGGVNNAFSCPYKIKDLDSEQYDTLTSALSLTTKHTHIQKSKTEQIFSLGAWHPFRVAEPLDDLYCMGTDAQERGVFCRLPGSQHRNSNLS